MATSSRLFVAVWSPPAFAEQLAFLPRPEQRGVRWVPPENWHVTLRFLGEADPADVGGRLDGATLSPATATLGPVVQRFGRGLVVVPVAGLDELAPHCAPRRLVVVAAIPRTALGKIRRAEVTNVTRSASGQPARTLRRSG